MVLNGEEKAPVRIKGVGDSFHITLDPTKPLGLLEEETAVLFERLRHLAANARVLIEGGGSEVPADLIEHMGRFLKSNFGVGEVAEAPKKDTRPEEDRKRDLKKSWYHQQSNVLMITGRVRSGQKIRARKHLVIMGDVNPGGEVYAGGDILIMGSLCGTALAGQKKDESAIILALDFRPLQVQIGGYVAAGPPVEKGHRAEYAHVVNGEIVVEDYLDENPFSKLPWPEVR